MAIGHFVLAVEHNIAFFLALSFIIVGNAFFKPNISTFVGTLYEDNDPRKDSGFTIFYMGINLGAWVSPLLCGWLAASYGWHYGFGLAGIGMVAGLLFFYSGIKKGVFGERGLPPEDSTLDQKQFGLSKEHQVTLLSVLSVPLIALLLSAYNPIYNQDTIVNLLFKGIGVFILGYLAYILYQVAPD